MKLFLLLFLFISKINNALAFELKSLESANDWSQARSMCMSLGGSWDLPTVSEVVKFYSSFQGYNSFLQKNLDSQELKESHLIWARADEEDLNHQLIAQSQVLKIEDGTLSMDSIAHSTARTDRLKNFRNQLRENIDRFSRTQAEQNFLLGFMEIYNSTDFGKEFAIDINIPLGDQDEELAYNVSQVVPSEILMVLLKPSRLYVETQIENMGYELELLEKGIQVICVKKD